MQGARGVAHQLRARCRTHALQGAQLQRDAIGTRHEHEAGQVQRHAIAQQAQAQFALAVAVVDRAQLHAKASAILAGDGGQYQRLPRRLFDQSARAGLPQIAVMPFQQGQPAGAVEPATGIRPIQLVAQAGMQARQGRHARCLRQERLPAPVLARIDEGAKGGFQAMAVGAVAQGGMGGEDHLAWVR